MKRTIMKHYETLPPPHENQRRPSPSDKGYKWHYRKTSDHHGSRNSRQFDQNRILSVWKRCWKLSKIQCWGWFTPDHYHIHLTTSLISLFLQNCCYFWAVKKCICIHLSHVSSILSASCFMISCIILISQIDQEIVLTNWIFNNVFAVTAISRR